MENAILVLSGDGAFRTLLLRPPPPHLPRGFCLLGRRFLSHNFLDHRFLGRRFLDTQFVGL